LHIIFSTSTFNLYDCDLCVISKMCKHIFVNACVRARARMCVYLRIVYIWSRSIGCRLCRVNLRIRLVAAKYDILLCARAHTYTYTHTYVVKTFTSRQILYQLENLRIFHPYCTSSCRYSVNKLKIYYECTHDESRELRKKRLIFIRSNEKRLISIRIFLLKFQR